MSDTMDIPDFPRSSTPEEVWALMRENALCLKKSWEKEQERSEREREKSERKQEKSEREMEDLKRQMKETARIIGNLGNRFGELAEHLVLPSINEKFNELNFTFETTSQNIRIADSTGKFLAEIDILLENGDVVIAVEVKAKPNQRDVDEHIERIEILRRRADKHQDKRRLQGAIAGAIMSDEVRNYAHKTGFYVIEQTGDTVKINIPKDFKPREW